MSNTDIQLDEKIKKTTKIPSKYAVIILNDDQTPMDWVIEILQIIFKYNKDVAEELVMKIHHEGSAIVGTYSYEIAEQKSIETVDLSRGQGFPLQVKVEEE